MDFHLVLTQKCNLNCTYCGSTVDPDVMAVNLNYAMADLQKFLSQLDDPPVIAFYGGEPTISHNKITEIMDFVDAKAFMLQTNGTLIHKIPKKYYPKFQSILISVDGRPETTDQSRGDGVHTRAIRGARYLRNNGFDGDLIARMTMTSDSEVFDDVVHLLNQTDPKFDHVHWQLDVLWGTEFDDKHEEIEQWLLERYNPGITKLVNYWIDYIIEYNEIPGIAPFMGIMHTLLSEEEVSLRCGAGDDFLSITTDGEVTICPILPSTSFAVVGDIFNSKTEELRNKITLDEPCISCDVKDICGGRCIYTNKTKFWGDQGFELVCKTVKHLINELNRIRPYVQNLIDNNYFEVEDFRYPKIPNGVEIIP